MLPLKHGIKDIKDVTIYISCVKGSLGALRGGGGVSACARRARHARESRREIIYSFLPSSRAARRTCALRPALKASQQRLLCKLHSHPQ